MDLPAKPSNSCALLHYLFQQPHNDQANATTHKLAACWESLFGFSLDLTQLPSKSIVTQFALVTRAMLFIYSSKNAGKYLATPIVMAQAKNIDKDQIFVQNVIKVVNTFMSPEEITALHMVFKRPIGGSPTYVDMYNAHRTRQSIHGSPSFSAWTKVCNMAGDTNTSFKPSTLQLLPKPLGASFAKHHLKKGKVAKSVKSSTKSSTSQHCIHQRSKKRHTPATNNIQNVTATKRVCAQRYPDPPHNGWMGLMTGTALCNFVAHMSPISGQELHIQMMSIDLSTSIMLMKASVEKNFILQTTANMTLFKTSLTNIPLIMVNANETAIIAKHFVKTAVCLIFNPSDNQYQHQPTLTFSSTTSTSAISFTLVVKVSNEITLAKKRTTFNAIANISLAIKLLKPLMSLDKVNNLHVTCEVDSKMKHLYITFRTISSAKSTITAMHRFSAELTDVGTTSNGIDTDKVSLFVVDKQNMYTGKIVPTNPSAIINIKAYANAQHKQRLQTVFSESYKLALIKAITKGIPCDQKMNIIMTKERMLLMSIHEYRGSIQVAQLPNIT